MRLLVRFSTIVFYYWKALLMELTVSTILRGKSFSQDKAQISSLILYSIVCNVTRPRL